MTQRKGELSLQTFLISSLPNHYQRGNLSPSLVLLLFLLPSTLSPSCFCLPAHHAAAVAPPHRHRRLTPPQDRHGGSVGEVL